MDYCSKTDCSGTKNFDQAVPPKPRDASDYGKEGIGYPDAISNVLFYIYIVAILIWIVLIIALRLYEGLDFIGWLILLIPLVLFALAASKIRHITYDVERYIFKNDYLSVGTVIVVPILIWLASNYRGDRQRYIRILITAIIFALLAILDCWIPRKWLPVERHIKTILQTFSIVLIIFALYSYFLEKPQY
jgi:hypothetical protein